MTQPVKYTLVRSGDFLGLVDLENKSSKPFYIDFLVGKMNYRANQAGLRKEALARALGTKPKDNPYIIDATAGLGRDSFILATLGYHVTMLEKSPIIFALLDDALARARANSPDNPCHRLTLFHGDATVWLPENCTDTKPDIIYLDPMFPKRKKSAAVKKDMQILNALLGHENDITELLQVSRATAAKRVIVKRPRLAPSDEPDFSVPGKSTRFDIYLIS